MSQELVTSDGLIAAGPSTSHYDYNAGEDPMELEEEELSGNESNLLDEGSEEELPSSQVSPRAKSRHRNTKSREPRARPFQTRKRRQFKNDISRIRKNAQQECVKALTRFHYRECDRFRSELQKEKRPRVPKKNATGTVVNKSFAKKKQTHSAPSENIVTLSNVNKLAESIQTKICKFGELLSTLQNMENKHVEQYTCLLSDPDTGKGTKRKQSEKRLRNRKRKVRKQKKNKKQLNAQLEANEKHIKNLSNQELTKNHINLLAKGLKFVPCPIIKETQIRKQLLRDYDNFTICIIFVQTCVVLSACLSCI